MSTARVRSIDGLRDFRTSFITFREDSMQAMAAVDQEIRRVLDWLQHDQLKYWQQEMRRREDAVGEAKADLNRCLMMTTATGDRPSCSDQQLALRKAKARLEEAVEKIKKVKHWSQVVEQEVAEYRGPAQQLNNVLEGQLPEAFELLDRMIDVLESYVNMAPPAAAPVLETSSGGESVTISSTVPASPKGPAAATPPTTGPTGAIPPAADKTGIESP
jgi:hypothetical protein